MLCGGERGGLDCETLPVAAVGARRPLALWLTCRKVRVVKR
jgi:hypothetical protein